MKTSIDTKEEVYDALEWRKSMLEFHRNRKSSEEILRHTGQEITIFDGPCQTRFMPDTKETYETFAQYDDFIIAVDDDLFLVMWAWIEMDEMREWSEYKFGKELIWFAPLHISGLRSLMNPLQDVLCTDGDNIIKY